MLAAAGDQRRPFLVEHPEVADQRLQAPAVTGRRQSRRQGRSRSRSRPRRPRQRRRSSRRARRRRGGLPDGPRCRSGTPTSDGSSNPRGTGSIRRGRETPVAPHRRAVPGHRRHPAGRVEPQRRIARSPARPDPVGALQDHGIRTGAAQACRGAQSGRPGSADHHICHAAILVRDPGAQRNAPDRIRTCDLRFRRTKRWLGWATWS